MRTWNEILHDPRIDDSGDYDYLAEELPQDDAHWIKNYPCHCDSCGKERRLNYRQNHYFYCYDGWDSMDYTECWKCVLSGKLHGYGYRCKKWCKRILKTLRFKRLYKKMSWRGSWDLACHIVK